MKQAGVVQQRAPARKSGAAVNSVLSQVFSKLMLYSILMFSVPFVLFWLSVHKCLDRKSCWDVELLQTASQSTSWLLYTPAAVYAATIGVPTPEKRTMVSGVIAVLVVNVVSENYIHESAEVVHASAGPHLH
jgi:hypothetical protein